MTVPVDFWFDFSCPYAYVAAERVESKVAAVNDAMGAGERIELRMRPMLLGGVFRALDVPQNLAASMHPNKARYQAADVHRTAKAAGVPLRWPSVHPRRTVTALRLLLALGDDGAAFRRRVYRAYWADDLDIGEASVLRGLLDALGLPVDALWRSAHSDEVKARLRAETDAAIQAGVFGAPALVVRPDSSSPQLFWGHDRIDAALAHASGCALPPLPSVPSARGAFYFDFSSPFAYLGAELVARHFGALEWKPILLGGLFRSLGTPDVPLMVQSDSKRAFTEADLVRQSERFGVAFRWPSHFPMRTVRPLRVALAAGCPTALVLALFRAYWAEDRDISQPETIAAICEGLGLDGAALLAASEADDVKASLRAETEAAEARGVFGVPSIWLGSGNEVADLFFGVDRIEPALAAAGAVTGG